MAHLALYNMSSMLAHIEQCNFKSNDGMYLIAVRELSFSSVRGVPNMSVGHSHIFITPYLGWVGEMGS